jgi:hypothetical protein
MGFGYNPRLTKSGERLDMLDFFTSMRSLQEAGINDWLVWDASCFYIVNRTPDKKIRRLGKLKGKGVIDVLIAEQERPKRREIRANCDARSDYLQKIIAISDTNATYISAWDVFRKDPAYATALDEAFEFCVKLESNRPDITAQLVPKGATEASRLYMPLEVAEALYLKDKYGIEAKFGPATEGFFDTAILQVQEERRQPYTAIRTPTGPRKPAYLADEQVITTKSVEWYVEELLQDSEYRQFVESYISPFRRESESLQECAARMRIVMGGAK